MGYKIDSIWTKMNENRIDKLNAIIDDHYCIENEIARKLSIMDQITQEFNREVNSINFDNIVNYMQANDWKWAFYDDGPSYRVPTKDEMITFLKENFLRNGLYDMIELGKHRFNISSGGFCFDISLNNGIYYVNIVFDIAHFMKDDIDE